MAQWINLNRNNRSVLAYQYSVLGEKNWPYPSTASGFYGREGGMPAEEMRVGFDIFKILYRLNYSGFYFVYYYCNVTMVLEQYFSRLLSSKACFMVC